jgi:hypothetical protein
MTTLRVMVLSFPDFTDISDVSPITLWYGYGWKEKPILWPMSLLEWEPWTILKSSHQSIITRKCCNRLLGKCEEKSFDLGGCPNWCLELLFMSCLSELGLKCYMPLACGPCKKQVNCKELQVRFWRISHMLLSQTLTNSYVYNFNIATFSLYWETRFGHIICPIWLFYIT